VPAGARGRAAARGPSGLGGVPARSRRRPRRLLEPRRAGARAEPRLSAACACGCR
jgi:hypothetical protein